MTNYVRLTLFGESLNAVLWTISVTNWWFFEPVTMREAIFHLLHSTVYHYTALRALRSTNICDGNSGIFSESDHSAQLTNKSWLFQILTGSLLFSS